MYQECYFPQSYCYQVDCKNKKIKKHFKNPITRQGIFVETDNNLKAVNVKKGLKSSTMTKVSIF